MGCIAQVLQDPVFVTVTPPANTDCCCNDIIKDVDPISILMKKIKVNILQGTVLCASDDSNPVGGAIVVATDGTNFFVGITNCDGEYSICVPTPDTETTFEVQAYCCCSCNGDFCEETPCTCSCNGACD